MCGIIRDRRNFEFYGEWRYKIVVHISVIIPAHNEEKYIERCIKSIKTSAKQFRGKVEIIVTFLAILELMKIGKIFISQEKIFDDIQIDSKIAA